MNLTDYTLAELEPLMRELSQPKFRARQVFEWLTRGARPEEIGRAHV